MDNVKNFVLKYDELFNKGVIKQMLDSEEYFFINTYRLLLKNDFVYNPDQNENDIAILFIIARLGVSFSVTKEELKLGTLKRILIMLASKMNLELGVYDEECLLHLAKANISNFDLSNREAILYLAYKNNISLNDYLGEILERRIIQASKYGEYVTFYRTPFRNTIADIYDIYNGDIKTNLNNKRLNKLYEYANNAGFNLNEQDKYKDKEVSFKSITNDYIDDNSITEVILKIKNNLKRNRMAK